MVKDADVAIKAKKYEDVAGMYVSLMAVHRVTKDPKEYAAQQDALFAMKVKLGDAAAAGDTRAQQLLKDLRTASGH